MIYELAPAKVQRIVRTHPVVCEKLVADSQYNLWCLGLDGEKRRARQDYEIIYKYSLEGRLLGQFFPRSVFPHVDHLGPQRDEPFFPGDAGLPQLFMSSNQKIGAWLPNVYEVLEWDLEGKPLTRAKLPGTKSAEGTYWARHLYSLAPLPDGRLVALLPLPRVEVKDDMPYGLYLLNRDTDSWDLLGTNWPSARPLSGLMLVGTDDSGLVVRRFVGGDRLIWLPLPR